MSRAVPVKGGPFDGTAVPKAGTYRWVSEQGGHAAPARGRALYRYREYGGFFQRERYYEYVGDSARWCGNCHAVTGRRRNDDPVDGRCGLCGGSTQPTYEPKEDLN